MILQGCKHILSRRGYVDGITAQATPDEKSYGMMKARTFAKILKKRANMWAPGLTNDAYSRARER